MRKSVSLSLIAAGLALAATPAAAQYAQATPQAVDPAAAQAQSVLLPNNGGLQLASGQRVTVGVDAATGALSIVGAEPLGFNAVAPGPGGGASVASTAQPGTVVYSLQGPVLKVENGLATPFNYSAVATLDIGGQTSSQTVKTCTVLPGRVAFEMWSATVKVPSVVLGAPVAYAGVPGCSN
jgi:hypothetical protein